MRRLCVFSLAFLTSSQNDECHHLPVHGNKYESVCQVLSQLNNKQTCECLAGGGVCYYGTAGNLPPVGYDPGCGDPVLVDDKQDGCWPANPDSSLAKVLCPKRVDQPSCESGPTCRWGPEQHDASAPQDCHVQHQYRGGQMEGANNRLCSSAANQAECATPDRRTVCYWGFEDDRPVVVNQVACIAGYDYGNDNRAALERGQPWDCYLREDSNFLRDGVRKYCCRLLQPGDTPVPVAQPTTPAPRPRTTSSPVGCWPLNWGNPMRLDQCKAADSPDFCADATDVFDKPVCRWGSRLDGAPTPRPTLDVNERGCRGRLPDYDRRCNPKDLATCYDDFNPRSPKVCQHVDEENASKKQLKACYGAADEAACLSVGAPRYCKWDQLSFCIWARVAPTFAPTFAPTDAPSYRPTEEPTSKPTVAPTQQPSERPTVNPSHLPTEQPTVKPSEQPTVPPTRPPTEEPTVEPTAFPTLTPTPSPTATPTWSPACECAKAIATDLYDYVDVTIAANGMQTAAARPENSLAPKNNTGILTDLQTRVNDYAQQLQDALSLIDQQKTLIETQGEALGLLQQTVDGLVLNADIDLSGRVQTLEDEYLAILDDNSGGGADSASDIQDLRNQLGALAGRVETLEQGGGGGAKQGNCDKQSKKKKCLKYSNCSWDLASSACYNTATGLQIRCTNYRKQQDCEAHMQCYYVKRQGCMEAVP